MFAAMEEQVKLGRYANVLMDRWFKRIFGWRPQKRLMQLFLQELIPERIIADINFGPQEYINPIELGKDIRLDIHCKDRSGAQFVVEVQVAQQDTFYERAIYNSTFVIQEQLPPGSTTWAFPQIYFIGIVDFSMHEGSDKVRYRYRLTEIDTGEQMRSQLEYIFLELPNCTKALTPTASRLDNLCYALRNISKMEEQPVEFEGEVFDLLFNSAEINKFAPAEKSEYLKDMTTQRDIANQFAFAEKKGIEKGIEQGAEQERINNARNFLHLGVAVDIISKATGLSEEEILALA